LEIFVVCPIVEVANDGNTYGLRGPKTEQAAGDAGIITGRMGAEDAPGGRRPSGEEFFQLRKKVVPWGIFPKKGHNITCLVGEEGSVGEMQQFRDGMSP
jgi:hypothetical protein